MHACSSFVADCPRGRGTMRAVASGHAVMHQAGRLSSRSVPISSAHRSHSEALFHVLFDGFAVLSFNAGGNLQVTNCTDR